MLTRRTGRGLSSVPRPSRRRRPGRIPEPPLPTKGLTRMSWLKNLPVARKLYGAFAVVGLLFAVALTATLLLTASAKGAWKHALGWNAVVDGAQTQIEGTRQQLASQALYVATF